MEWLLVDAEYVRVGKQELRAHIIDGTWIGLRASEDGELLRLSLVEAAQLVDLLRVQVNLLAFGANAYARDQR